MSNYASLTINRPIEAGDTLTLIDQTGTPRTFEFQEHPDQSQPGNLFVSILLLDKDGQPRERQDEEDSSLTARILERAANLRDVLQQRARLKATFGSWGSPSAHRFELSKLPPLTAKQCSKRFDVTEVVATGDAFSVVKQFDQAAPEAA